MPNEIEAMAIALIRLLHEATDGDSLPYRSIRRLDGATDEAVAFAAERGWLQRDDSGRVALGCGLVGALIRTARTIS